MTVPACRSEEVARRRLLAFLLSVTAASLGGATYASAATPTNGCPEGFEVISVAQAESEGYRLARVVDESVDQSPKPGNRDSYACRRPLGDGVFHDFPGRHDTIYWWMDNRLI